MWILVTHLLTVLGFLLCVLLIHRLFRAHQTPGVTMAWLLAIVLIPYVGVPAYLVFGGRKLRRMAKRKGAIYDLTRQGRVGEVECTTERVLVTAGMPPARQGNQIEFLPDGEAAFAALVSLVEGATHHVHVMTFILKRDATGRAIVDLLARKAAEGVEVCLLLDALGCLWSRGRFVDPVRRAGGKVAVFMPVLPLSRKSSANLRNHRKIAVADGRTAMIGGMNLAEEYMGPRPNANRWLDTGAVVRGPAAADLDALFAGDWHFASDEPLATVVDADAGVVGSMEEGDSPIFAARKSGQSPGASVAQIAASGPDTPSDAIYEAIVTAMMEARERIWIVTPYFIPDESLMMALMLQARLGRDVRIVVPRRSNHWLADLARGRFLRELVGMGAQVYTYPRMVHAKLMVFDAALAVVGSANLDMRSLYLNYEVQLLMYSQRDIDATEQWIQQRMAESSRPDASPVSAAREWAEDLGALVAPLL